MILSGNGYQRSPPPLETNAVKRAQIFCEHAGDPSCWVDETLPRGTGRSTQLGLFDPVPALGCPGLLDLHLCAPRTAFAPVGTLHQSLPRCPNENVGQRFDRSCAARRAQKGVQDQAGGHPLRSLRPRELLSPARTHACRALGAGCWERHLLVWCGHWRVRHVEKAPWSCPDGQASQLSGSRHLGAAWWTPRVRLRERSHLGAVTICRHPSTHRVHT